MIWATIRLQHEDWMGLIDWVDNWIKLGGLTGWRQSTHGTGTLVFLHDIAAFHEFLREGTWRVLWAITHKISIRGIVYFNQCMNLFPCKSFQQLNQRSLCRSDHAHLPCPQTAWIAHSSENPGWRGTSRDTWKFANSSSYRKVNNGELLQSEQLQVQGQRLQLFSVSDSV